MLRNRQIKIIVSLRIPKVEVHSLLDIVVDASEHGLHLYIEVLDQLVTIVSVNDLW